MDALKTVPEVNAYIEGDEIVRNHYYDIGIAVSTDKGLGVLVDFESDTWVTYTNDHAAGVGRAVIQRGAEVAQLHHRKGDLLNGLGPGIELLDRDAFLEGVDGHVFLQRGLALIHKGDNGGVEFVLDAEHGASLWRDFASASDSTARDRSGGAALAC